MHYNAREDAGMNGKRSRRVFRPRPMTTNEQYSMLMDIAYRIGDRVMLASTLRRLKEVLQ
jgi:GH24 family phage-related lysozyme (muramidase)